MYGLCILSLIVWIIVGLVNLISTEPISRLTYGLTWGVLVLSLLANCLS